MAFRCCRTRGRPLTAWNTDSLEGAAARAPVVEQILSHSDGVALFLEELTRMLLESGEEGLRLADSLNHPYSQVFALWMLGRAHVIRGDLSNAVPLHQRGLAINTAVSNAP
jgi:hypothetical protein